MIEGGKVRERWKGERAIDERREIRGREGGREGGREVKENGGEEGAEREYTNK